ncbi:MAG: hypothetical protein ABF324_00875 [Lentimonas sp.]
MRSAVTNKYSLKQKIEEIQDRNAQLDHREQELHIMEEEMVDRMNEYMEKMAQFEQWD